MMYLKQAYAFILFLSVFGADSSAQFLFDIKTKDITYARSEEKAANSKPVTLSSTYINPPGIADPIVFERKETSLPNLWVYYFSNAKDSTIHHVLYEWDDSNFEKDHHSTTQPISILNNYVTKYRDLLKQVSATFGQPETTGSIEDLSLIETGKFKRRDTFVKNGVEVDMYIVLSNKEVTSGIVSISPTHRIRLYVKPAGQQLR